MTKVRAEDKNLTLFRSDEVCVFYEIRFLNFARWFPRSGSRKDNGAFATFFPACKVSEPLMDTSATFSETLSARWASSPLGQGQRKKKEKRKEEKGRRRETRSWNRKRATIFFHFPSPSTVRVQGISFESIILHAVSMDEVSSRIYYR